MAISIGTVLNNRYRIVKLLGEGGFGAVYRAWDLSLQHPCAVKENLLTSLESRQQFEREAIVLAQLAHPNLPRVTDHFSIPDQGQYLVMDFVDGKELVSLLGAGVPLPPEQVMHWVAQIADALVYMHNQRSPDGSSRPVIHRDIKPANILITPDGRAVLVDFGLLKLYDQNTNTALGARGITPGFSPPEQYGQGNTDVRTDVYALGATLYNLLTGSPPPESTQRMAGKALVPPHVLVPGIPQAVSRAIVRSMQLDPSQRFQSVSEFKTSLFAPDQGKHQQPVRTVQVSPYESEAGTSSPHPATLQVHPLPASPPRGISSVWWLAGGAGLVLMAICAVAGILAYSNGLIFPTPTITPNLAATDSAIRLATEEAEQRRQATTQAEAQLQATQTAAALSAKATLDYLASLTDFRLLFYGPDSGSLPLAEDALVSYTSTGVSLKDMLVESWFTNPYDAATHDWDYGFMFRDQGGNDQYRLVVSSWGNWELINSTEAGASTISSGRLTDLNTGQNGQNYIQLIVLGNQGWFFLNSVLQSTLDLSARTNPGDVSIASGLYSEDKLAGYSTGYSSFSINAIPTGAQPISYGETVTSSLDVPGLSKFWVFNGTVDDVITVSMSSSWLDSFLVIFGPDGIMLTQDDDSGTDSDALIADLRLPATGTYFIQTRAYGTDGTGPFILTIFAP